MNVKFGWKTIATLLSSFALTIGLAGCGSSDQSNPPLVKTDSVVELVSSSLQYNAAGTIISGTITTKYPITLSGTATLSGFSSSLTNCSVSSTTIGTDTVTYIDNNNVVSDVQITLSSTCSATSVTLSATETDDANAISSWSEIASVNAAGDITSPIVAIIPDDATKNVVLTQNNEPRRLVFKVYEEGNVPATSGSISVRYPNEVLNGVDVGSLSPVKTASIADNGVAVFDYTGPSNLTGLAEENITSATFVFYDAENESTIANVTITYEPDTTVPPAVLTSYDVEFIGSNAAPTINLDDVEVFTLSIKDNKGNLVPDADVNATIISNQSDLVKFLDEDGNEVTSMSFTETNPATLRLKTNTIAGLADFDIQLQIRDANGAVGDKNVTKAVTVFSGPATAITIHYRDTELDEYGIFNEKMIVRLADKWDNPVNTHPKIYVGGIAGYKTAAASGVGNDYLIDGSKTGTISQDPVGAKLTVASGIDLSDIDEYNDVLMTYGDDYKFHASGKWDIDSVVGTDIFLKDAFNSSIDVDGIAFAIGRNYRNDLCTNDKYVVNVDSADGTYVVNSDGVAVVDISYEPRAVGQQIMISVNLIGMVNELGEEIRLGEIEEVTLRGHGLDNPGSYTVAANASGTVDFSIKLTDVPEFLRSARFDYLDETTGDVNATCTSSADTKADQYSITACQSWISCDYIAGPGGGSINIKGAILADEF